MGWQDQGDNWLNSKLVISQHTIREMKPSINETNFKVQALEGLVPHLCLCDVSFQLYHIMDTPKIPDTTYCDPQLEAAQCCPM